MSSGIHDIEQKNGDSSLISRISASFLFRFFISLLLAVVIWLTVNAMYLNPPGETTIKTSLTLLGRSSLDNLNLELITESFKTSVDVVVKGRQEDLDRLTVGDFEAFVDFNKVAGIEDTELEVELRTANTDRVSIVRIEPSEIPIEIERRKTKTFDVVVQFTGEPADGFYLSNYTRFPSTRSFSARESLVDQIDRVIVDVDLSGLAGNTVIHQQCRIYNENGGLLNRLGWEQVVDVNLEVSKDVPVVPNVSGSPAEDFYVRYVTVSPENVRISGTKEALEQVDSLNTEVLDISLSRQSVSQDRQLVLPNNIRLSMDSLPRATIDVTIFKYQYTQDVSLSKGRIELMNSQDEFRYEIVESEIPMLLKGKVDDIANMDPNQVNAVIDVEGLTPGTHAVSAIVTLPEGVINVNDVLVSVIVARN